MFCPISAVALAGIKICYVHAIALGMRMRKLLLALSLAQKLHENINKILSPISLGFIDVNRTVSTLKRSLKGKTGFLFQISYKAFFISRQRPVNNFPSRIFKSSKHNCCQHSKGKVQKNSIGIFRAQTFRLTRRYTE